MSAWASMTGEARLNSIKSGMASGLAPGDIASLLGAPIREVRRIAAEIEIPAGDVVRSGVHPVGPSAAAVPGEAEPRLKTPRPASHNGGGGHEVEIAPPPASQSIGNGPANADDRASARAPASTPSGLVEVPRDVRNSPPGWNEAREFWLGLLWKEGLSCSVIAAQLGGGLSRNAVIGKIHRMSLPGTETKVRRPAGRRARAPKPRSTGGYARPRPPALPAVPRIERPRPPIEDVVVPVSLNLSIMDLTEETCRWPIGDPPAVTFCGHKPFENLPYCEYHSRVAYQPVNDRRARWNDERREAARIAGLKRAAAREGMSWTAN